MENQKLNLTLRNYLITSKIPLSFINFEKSLISDDSRVVPKNLQILVLEKPHDVAFEIGDLKWLYPARTVLLFFNKTTELVTLIPLEFQFKLPGMTEETKFNFCGYQSLKISENHFLIANYGRELKGDRECLNVALFTIDGKIISVWQANSINSYKYSVDDFHQLKPNHWIAKIEFNRGEGHNRMVHGLHLLSLNRIETNTLSLGEEFSSRIGSLLGSDTSEMSSWFSEEIDGISHFFVLASHYQCCIYRHDHDDYFNKIADITLEGSFIDDVDNTYLNEDDITVNFDNGRTSITSGSFHLAFRK